MAGSCTTVPWNDNALDTAHGQNVKLTNRTGCPGTTHQKQTSSRRSQSSKGRLGGGFCLTPKLGPAAQAGPEMSV